MGMYVCKPCLTRYRIEDEGTERVMAIHLMLTGGPIYAPCEICGPVDGDWEYKQTYWTSSLDRPVGSIELANPKQFVERQLAELNPPAKPG